MQIAAFTSPTPNRMTRKFLYLCLCLVIAACSKQQDCSSVDRLIGTTYGFKPATLDSTQRTAKSKAMDAFWDTVRTHSSDLLPCLRSAIPQSTDPFFQFDAASLLVGLDSSREAKAAQLVALERVDLNDVNLADWMHLVTQRALEGFNTTRAASRWFELPDSAASYYLPQHGAFHVDRTYGALFLFGSMPESLATPQLTTMARDAQHKNRETAVWLLVQQATPESRQALVALPRDGLSSNARNAIDEYLRTPPPPPTVGTPRVSRAEFTDAFKALRSKNPAPFLALVERVPNGEQDAAVVLQVEDLPDVRFARRFFVAAGTPEAVGYYRDFTGIIERVLSRK